MSVRTMAADHNEAIAHAAQKFPRAKLDTGEEHPDFQYGTAGFRMREDLLDYVIYGVGLLAALRSRKLQGHTIGVMITASHNPAEDNGVKLVDPMGDMLEADWEPWATKLANAREPQELVKQYAEIVSEFKIDMNKSASVIFARDTRPSGSRLIEPLKAALEAVGARYTDFEVQTTPVLHYLVRATNTSNTPQPYGEVSEEGYYNKLASAFEGVMKYVSADSSLTVDCANGVGGPKLKKLIEHLPKDKVTINVVNDNVDQPEVLNKGCGADFVKTRQKEPTGFNGGAFARWASFDGDADRIVYYFHEEGGVFRLLDGDRIATLAASFIGDLVRKSGLDDKIKLAVVQTAYANGSSTKYIEQNLKLGVECTPTGVKHLHRAASRHDIGVYFEANGHGTILFSPQCIKTMNKHEVQSPAQMEALETLKSLVDLINQTVGDALSDMLIVEAVLAHKGYTVKEWLATYTDLPNKLGKVNVPDRDIYITVPGTAERKLQAPAAVQTEIDRLVPMYREGRCFVRASGTENAVRVYAEAAEKFDVEDLIIKVTEFISNV